MKPTLDPLCPFPDSFKGRTVKAPFEDGSMYEATVLNYYGESYSIKWTDGGQMASNIAPDAIDWDVDQLVKAETTTPEPVEDELWLAARRGSLTSTKRFVEEVKVDYNAQGESGRTPFYWACLCGHVAVCEYLIGLGATDPEDTCYVGATDEGVRALLAQHGMAKSVLVNQEDESEVKKVKRVSSLPVFPQDEDPGYTSREDGVGEGGDGEDGLEEEDKKKEEDEQIAAPKEADQEIGEEQPEGGVIDKVESVQQQPDQGEPEQQGENGETKPEEVEATLDPVEETSRPVEQAPEQTTSSPTPAIVSSDPIITGKKLAIAGFTACPYYQKAALAIKQALGSVHDVVSPTRDEYQVWLKEERPKLQLEGNAHLSHTTCPFVWDMDSQQFIGGCDDTLAFLLKKLPNSEGDQKEARKSDLLLAIPSMPSPKGRNLAISGYQTCGYYTKACAAIKQKYGIVHDESSPTRAGYQKWLKNKRAKLNLQGIEYLKHTSSPFVWDMDTKEFLGGCDATLAILAKAPEVDMRESIFSPKPAKKKEFSIFSPRAVTRKGVEGRQVPAPGQLLLEEPRKKQTLLSCLFRR